MKLYENTLELLAKFIISPGMHTAACQSDKASGQTPVKQTADMNKSGTYSEGVEHAT